MHPEYQGTNLVASGDPAPGKLSFTLFIEGASDDWSDETPMILDAALFDDESMILTATRLVWNGIGLKIHNFSDLSDTTPPLEDAYWVPTYEKVQAMVVPAPSALVALIGLAGVIGQNRRRTSA